LLIRQTPFAKFSFILRIAEYGKRRCFAEAKEVWTQDMGRTFGDAPSTASPSFLKAA